MQDHLREILKSLPRLSQAFPDMFEEDEAVDGAKPARSAR